MSSNHPDQPPLQVRFIVSCPRSGSTLLMRVFAEATSCAVTSRLVLMGNYDKAMTFKPDYSIMENPESHAAYLSAAASGKRFLVSKEELGNNFQKGECDYDIFPNVAAYDLVKPAFLLRDPTRTFDSWKHVGWLDVESLIRFYTGIYRMLNAVAGPYLLVYERLILNPRTEIEGLCDWWGVPFDDSMLQFKQPFGSFWFNSERERKIYCDENPLGLFTTVRAHPTVVSDIPCHRLLSNGEKEYIESKIGMQYLECWKDKVEEVRGVLQTKTWFGFDLDDTLHEFRKASSAAVSATLRVVSQKHTLPIGELKTAYSSVLSRATAGAFTDGKTSNEYRRERFSALLQEFSIPPSSQLLDELLQTYEAALEDSLELKCGALNLLTHLKAIGKKVAVITEGPQDAQERTLEKLGLTDKVDFLATTSFFRVSKVTGLFGKVLGHLGVGAEDMVFIGDSKERDVVPATEQGIYAIHYAEGESFSLDACPVRVNTLKKLEHILAVK